jgi:hypothetical protein
MHPLIQEAMKKAAVAWLTAPGVTGRYAVWCLWIEDGMYLVTGEGEQPAPGLAGAGTVDVSVRGDHGGRILTWPASVTRIEPGGPEWDAVAPQLAAKRLNAPGSTDETVGRWAATCRVYRLAPVADPVEAGPTLSQDSGAEPPRPTPAASRTPKPFRLHRVRGAR